MITALILLALVFAPYGVASAVTDVAVFIVRRRLERLRAREQVGRLGDGR